MATTIAWASTTPARSRIDWHAGLAEDHRGARLPCLARDVEVALDGHPGEAARLEHTRDRVPDAAIAEDDRVAPQAVCELLVGRHRDWVARASSASPIRLPTASNGSAVRIEMTTAPIARLNESGRTAPSARPVEASTKLNSPLWPMSAPARARRRRALAVEPGEDRDRHRLAEGDDQQQRQHHRPCRQDRAGVEQDPDRDEEERAEQLAQRDDLSEHAVGKVGVGEGQSGDERSERNAHPERAGREGGADGDDGHADDEQLPRPEAGDQAKQPREKP